MTVRRRAQVHMDDKFLEDSELQGLLEEREALKVERAESIKALREKDAAVRERVGAYDFPVGEHRRCGSFLLTKTRREAQAVEFERVGGVSLAIRKVVPKPK